ncbi:MAG TPA: FkbM family methyltransferase [Gemmatimonadaceae bacterium]|nr:FkbM family methyltransferase [Gemmatimonadaceae bacterium]
MELTERLASLLSGTPLEGVARAVWSELRAIGHPRARQSRRYDRETHQIIRRVVEPDSNCIDIGANRGVFLSAIVELAPRGTHVAFEPLPDLAAALRRRFPQCTVHEVALSTARGQRTFCRVASDLGLSGFRRMGHVPENAHTQELVVATDRLDALIPETMPIRFMKLDVEGAQYEAVQGGVNTIRRARPYIVFEHGALARESYGTTSEMMYDLLVGECGLRISLMEDWLADRAPLTREQFAGHVGFHRTSHFCFLAHP